jgi:outer membrane protein TolC
MKKRICLGLALLVFAGALWPQAGSAQAARQELVLDLDECVRLALERNPDFIMARQEVQMKEAAAAAAYGRFFPSLSFTSRLTFLDPSRIKEGESDVGRFMPGYIPGVTPPVIIKTVESPLFTMGLSAAYAIPGIPFFSDGAFGLANAAHDLALKDLEVSRNKMRKTVRDVKAEISKVFYQLRLSELMFALTKANDERLQAYHDVAQRNFLAGRVSQYEFLRAQVQLANNQPELLRSENAARLARVALLQKLFLDLDLGLEAKGDLKTDFIFVNEDDALASAIANRTELKDIEASVEVMKLQAKLSKFGSRPQLAAFANYDWELRKKGSMLEQLMGAIDRKLHGNWVAGIQISIPLMELLNPASASHKGAKQYEFGIERAETMKRNVESLIKLEIRRNVLLLEENRKAIDAQVTALTLSTEGLRVARVAYGAGQIGNVELMDAELDFQRAQLMEYQAWFGYISAKIDLQNAMGTL